MVLRLTLPLALALLLVACGGGADGGGIPPTAPPTPGSGQPDGPLLPLIATALATAQAGLTAVADETLVAVIAARQDLARRAERDVEEVKLELVTRKQWPNSCLGLPKENEVCAEVITSGYEVVLRLDADRYTYRTDDIGRNIRLADGERFDD